MKLQSGGARKLGTFGGVFTPSILTILGIIFFLRLGYVVGNAGLGQALLILLLATAISILTSTSLSAVATNRKVRGGGDYYLISRSLGVAYGGALGLILFAAQAVSVAFYSVGFGEALASVLGDPSLARPVAAGVVAVLLVLAYAGADLATRFQYLIMVILVAALFSFFAGSPVAWDTEQFRANWHGSGHGLGFWPIFAIFFPAVTGFTQGVSMSGDLKDPARSLPLGTFVAIGISTLIYLGAMLVLAAGLPAEHLAGDYLSMKRIAVEPRLIDAGVLAATLSSALASFLGAPRILQALAADRVFTSLSFFAATGGAARNPRRAVLLTGAVAFVTVLAGDLNAIASVVSMFFLISYGLLNYATYVEATGASPSFRPRFRFFHARLSLLGTLLCAGVMLAVNPTAGIVAIAIVAAVYHYVRRTAVPAQWRDSRRAYRFHRIKEGLQELAQEPEKPLDWQPHILVFTESGRRRERVLRFASWVSGGSGMTTAVQIIEGEGALESTRERRDKAAEVLESELVKHELDAFPLVISAPDLRVGAMTLVQAWGVGPVRSNTVLLNWFESLRGWNMETASFWYTRLLTSSIRMRQNVLVLDAEDDGWRQLLALPGTERRIDVWWWDDESSRLSLLFAYLMTRTPDWDGARIRLLSFAAAKAAKSVEHNLTHRLEEYRIEAEIEVVVDADAEAIGSFSSDAALVFLPLRISGMAVVDPFDEPIDGLLARLPVTAMVAASQDIRLRDEEEPQGSEEEPEDG